MALKYINMYSLDVAIEHCFLVWSSYKLVLLVSSCLCCLKRYRHHSAGEVTSITTEALTHFLSPWVHCLSK